MDELLVALGKLGFSQYEARAYVALLKAPRVSGYELAKRSGIPQSKIYEVIDKLGQRELIVRIEEGGVTRYVPLDPARAVARYRSDYSGAIELVGKRLQFLYTEEQGGAAYVLSFRGGKDICAKTTTMVDGAEAEIYLMVWPNELDHVRSALEAAAKRSVAIATCVYGPEELNLGAVYHHGVDDRVRRNQRGRRMVIVIDSREALVAYYPDTEGPSAHWSANDGFVQMVKDYIRHDIWMVRMIQDFGQLFVDRYGADREGLRDIFARQGAGEVPGSDAERAPGQGVS